MEIGSNHHELAHSAHARLQGGLDAKHYAEQEVIAEFTAVVLAELYGLGGRTGNASDPLVAIVKALSTVEKVLGLLGV